MDKNYDRGQLVARLENDETRLSMLEDRMKQSEQEDGRIFDDYYYLREAHKKLVDATNKRFKLLLEANDSVRQLLEKVGEIDGVWQQVTKEEYVNRRPKKVDESN